MTIREARYTPSKIKAHQNNPLIETLTSYQEWGPRAVLEKLAQHPDEVSQPATRTQNTAWLSNLPSHLFVPTKRHYALFETIDLLIRQGYVHRNPVTADRDRRLDELYARQQAGEIVTEGTFDEEVHEQLTASLIGTSGMGKTRTVDRILSLYPQVISHTRSLVGGPFLQIVYLHVECPHNGSVNALCRNILAEVDRLTNKNYIKERHITDRTTLESLKNALVYVLAVHYVGIIVIDEIQNLASSRKNREDLFNFIVSLSNSLNVPLLFVGTPKVSDFIANNMRTARRFGTRGFINWLPLTKGSTEWRKFIDELWRYSRLQQDEEEIPPEVENKLFECSFGIIEILVKLFILTQTRILLITSKKNSETKQCMTPDAIAYVFEEYFKNLKPILAILHKGDMDALLKIEDLALPTSIEQLVSSMKYDLDDREDLEAEELEQSDLREAIVSNVAYSGDDIPPVAKDIALGLVDGMMEGDNQDKL